MADQIHLWAADTTPGRSDFLAYFLLKLNNRPTAWWTPMGNATLENVNDSLPLPVNQAFFIKVQPTTTQWRINWP